MADAGAGAVFFTAAITVGLSAAVGYGLYRIATVKGEAKTATDYGRKWLAWMLMIGTLTTLPSFFSHLDLDSFAKWIVVVIFYGGVAFIIGWAYGKLFGGK